MGPNAGSNAPADSGRAGLWARTMSGRDRDERHRVATNLELFFDLCFVGAVSQAAEQLGEFLAEGRYVHGVASFGVVFFAVWWAWMNFTWFASAYDTDDVLYRVMVLVQIGGGLVLAAGVPRAMTSGDLSIAVAGYVVMRVPMVGQWLRAARDDPPRRGTALRYAAGIALVQTGWVVRLLLVHGTAGMVWFAVLGVADLAVPVWAERKAATPWHPHHIAERYGLFTIIVLGESVLAATRAVQAQVSGTGPLSTLGPVAGGGLLVVFGMWWFYFAIPAHDYLTSNRVVFVWGYGHYLILSSAAAVGAGLGVVIAQSTGHTQISATGAAASVTIPVALYLVAVWALHLRPYASDRVSRFGPPAAALVVLAATFTGQAVLVAGLAVAGLIGVFLTMKTINASNASATGAAAEQAS
jgi:low temperature requirement protein LtrA